MKSGTIVFFKKFHTSVRPQSPLIGCQGFGYGIMLGHLKNGVPHPPAHVLQSQIGEAGYISFDDVKEFIGEEHLKTCLAKHLEKYQGVLPEDSAAQVELALHPPAPPENASAPIPLHAKPSLILPPGLESQS